MIDKPEVQSKILIVEDDMIVALDMQLSFRTAGYDVVGPARTVSDAIDMIKDEQPDMVTLDYNLQNETSVAVAQLLTDRGITFVFVTGRPAELIAYNEVPRAPVLTKPVSPDTILKTLTA